MNPVRVLRTDLAFAGMTIAERRKVSLAYEEALTTTERASWERFYRLLFAALASLTPQRSRGSLTRTRLARESLLTIVEDDLGAELFDSAALGALRWALRVHSRFDEPAQILGHG